MAPGSTRMTVSSCFRFVVTAAPPEPILLCLSHYRPDPSPFSARSARAPLGLASDNGVQIWNFRLSAHISLSVKLGIGTSLPSPYMAVKKQEEKQRVGQKTVRQTVLRRRKRKKSCCPNTDCALSKSPAQHQYQTPISPRSRTKSRLVMRTIRRTIMRDKLR